MAKKPTPAPKTAAPAPKTAFEVFKYPGREIGRADQHAGEEHRRPQGADGAEADGYPRHDREARLRNLAVSRLWLGI